MTIDPAPEEEKIASDELAAELKGISDALSSLAERVAALEAWAGSQGT